MYRPVLVTAPTTFPVTMDEVKAHVGAADFTDDDTMLQGFRAAAISHLDGWTGILGRCLEQQTWRQDYDWFARCLRLPLFPVISIESVKYDDTAGLPQTVDPSNYDLLNDDLGAYVRFRNTYGFAAISVNRPALHVQYVAGYATAGSPAVSTVPQAIKNAMLLLIGHWYANREAAVIDARAAEVVTPFAVDALLTPFRRVRF